MPMNKSENAAYMKLLGDRDKAAAEIDALNRKLDATEVQLRQLYGHLRKIVTAWEVNRDLEQPGVNMTTIVGDAKMGLAEAIPVLQERGGKCRDAT